MDLVPLRLTGSIFLPMRSLILAPGSGSRKRRHNQVLKKAHEYIKPQFSLYELTVGMQQKLMFQYLFPLGEYQEVNISLWTDSYALSL